MKDELPFEEVDKLSKRVLRREIGQEEPWQGADVKVLGLVDTYTNPKGSFYPDDRLLRTIYIGEVSWLFVQLRNIFNTIEGYGLWKEEFFGRITNVANAFLERVEINESSQLLLAILHETYAILEEMQDGEFQILSLAFGNQIAHDLINDSERKGFLSIEETREFLFSRGIES